MATARIGGVGVAIAIGGLLVAGGRRPVVSAVGLSVLAVVAFGPVVQPWYLLWGLVPLAAAGPGRLRPVLVWISAGVCLLVLPNGSVVPAGFVLGFVVATAAVAVVSGRRAGRESRLVPV